MTVLGKFSVVMADPPWDIHMEVHAVFHLSFFLVIHSFEITVTSVTLKKEDKYQVTAIWTWT